LKFLILHQLAEVETGKSRSEGKSAGVQATRGSEKCFDFYIRKIEKLSKTERKENL
jgi:hypothetical protein